MIPYKKRLRISYIGSVLFHVLLFLIIAFTGWLSIAPKAPNVIEVELMGGHGGASGGGKNITATASNTAESSKSDPTATVVPPDAIMQYVEQAEKVFKQQTGDTAPSTATAPSEGSGTSTSQGQGQGAGQGNGNGEGTESGDGHGHGQGEGSGTGSGYHGDAMVMETPPVPTYQVSPDFPEDAVDNNQEASFTARFTIDAQGTVINVDILSANVPSSFIQPTKRALSQWRFSPAKNRYGEPIPVTVTLPLRFQLE